MFNTFDNAEEFADFDVIWMETYSFLY